MTKEDLVWFCWQRGIPYEEVELTKRWYKGELPTKEEFDDLCEAYEDSMDEDFGLNE